MTDDSVLLSDQVFQLNTFLWTLQDLPKGGPTDPIFRKAGYYLRAIDRQVNMPTREPVIVALASLTGDKAREPSSPDLWLKHSSEDADVVIELKAHGFSEESSNRRQALKMIASAADLAPSLSEASRAPGHVVYATVSLDAEALSQTLRHLVRRLEDKNVPAAPTAVIGFSMKTDGVALSSPSPEDLPVSMADILAKPKIVLCRDDTNDLQPLYFVPWVPGIKGSQDAELQSAGLAELTARVLIHAQADIGRANVPTRVVLSGTRLLSQATFGMFDYWRGDERPHFSRKVADILVKALKPVDKGIRRESDRVEVDLADNDTKDIVIARFEQADPFDPASNLELALDAQLAFDL